MLHLTSQSLVEEWDYFSDRLARRLVRETHTYANKFAALATNFSIV
jgi:hypothetical protein